jgi:hypothetical protein
MKEQENKMWLMILPLLANSSLVVIFHTLAKLGSQLYKSKDMRIFIFLIDIWPFYVINWIVSEFIHKFILLVLSILFFFLFSF